jgi:lysine-specific demethylase 8
MNMTAVCEQPPELAIARIAAPSERIFERDYVEASRPVIFTDLVARWKATRCWSPDYFRSVWGEHRIMTVLTRGRYAQHFIPDGFVHREMLMRQALDLMQGGTNEGAYVITPLERYLPGLHDDLEIPEYCKGRPGFRSHLWMNAPDIGVPLHRDFYENLISQVVGSKQFVLYPPDDWHRLYAFQREAPSPGWSPVDGEAPDPQRFPRCAEARRIVLTLHAGETLFLPSRWWHQVRSLEHSMNVNFWWATGVYEKILRVAHWLGLSQSV